jgi:hypothetical protein
MTSPIGLCRGVVEVNNNEDRWGVGDGIGSTYYQSVFVQTGRPERGKVGEEGGAQSDNDG